MVTTAVSIIAIAARLYALISSSFSLNHVVSTSSCSLLSVLSLAGAGAGFLSKCSFRLVTGVCSIVITIFFNPYASS